MQFQNSVLALVAFVASVNAHMVMTSPKPYGSSSLTNSPLLADGSDFPCKQRSGVYDAEGASNTFPIGSTQQLAFKGSAVHGGGSCQVSITYDKAPTKSSVWKVIHSIEGGCPMKGVTGNNGDNANAVDPDTYSFTIPSSVNTGEATLAWTWFNKIGNREMYMNCAPVTITAGSSKRDEEELVSRNETQILERAGSFDSLPDMFVANVGNGCGTVDSTDLLFPNPGDSVEQDGLATKTALSTPTGSSCGSKVAGAAPTAGSGSASGAAASSPSAAAPAPAATSAPAVSPGVFATVAPASGTAPAASATDAPASEPSTPAPASSASAPVPAPASSVAPASPAVVPASTGSSAGAQSGACTTEGAWNCIGGTSFQRCASGTWSVVQALAAGTSCTPGVGANINMVAPAKRSIRFSNEHIRRHVRRSS